MPITDVTSQLSESNIASKTVQWSLIDAPSPHKQPAGCCAVNCEGRVVMLFGGDREGGVTDAVHTYSKDQGWSSVSVSSADGPSPRSGAAACVLSGGDILVQGGADPAQGVMFDDCWVLSKDLSCWTRVNLSGVSQAQLQRHGHQICAVQGGSILVVGGAGMQGPLWDPIVIKEDGWVCSETVPESLLQIPPREMFSLTKIENQIFAVGGKGIEALCETVTVIDATSLEVIKHEDLPEPRVSHSAFVVDGAVVCFGGTNLLHPPAFKDALAIKLKQDGTFNFLRWEPSSEELPDRFASTATVINDTVVVFGGMNFEKDLRDTWTADCASFNANHM